MKKTPNLRNLYFSNELADVQCVGLGGATAMTDPKCLSSVVAEIANSRPDIVFLHVGENDILNGKEPEAVANEIVRMAAQLTGDVKRGIVGHVINLMTGQPRRQLFQADEIHLSDEGQYRYHNSLSLVMSKTIPSLTHIETHMHCLKEEMSLEIARLVDESPSQSEVQLNDLLPDLIGTDEEKMELM